MANFKFEDIEKNIKAGEYKKAQKKLDYIREKNQIKDSNILLFYTKQCQILNNIGNFSKLIEVAQKLQLEAEKQKNVIKKLDGLLEEIFANYRLNKIEHSLKLVRKAEELIKKSDLEDVKQRKSQLLVYETYIYCDKGDIDKASVLAQENYFLCKEINDPNFLGKAYFALGWVTRYQGKIDEAIDNFQKSLALREKIGYIYDIAHSLFNIGFALRYKGQVDDAEEKFIKCLKLREKIGNQQDINWTLINLGDIYYEKGNLRKAQEYYEKSIQINREINFDFGIIFSLRRLAQTYAHLEEPQLVIDALKKALVYSQKLELVNPEVYVLFDLVNYITSKGIKSNSANQYLNRLKIINKQKTTREINLLTRLAEALVLEKSSDIKKRKKAKIIFQQITEEEVIYYYYTILAMSHYGDMLIEDLRKHLGEDQLLTELSEITGLISHTQFQQSYSSMVESLLYQSKSAMEKINIEKARNYLAAAQRLNDFLELYNKGATPFIILYLLFIKERSLTEISKILGITKGALTSHIKLLSSLDLIRISREEQVRSATILKKYYILGKKGTMLIKPFQQQFETKEIKIDEKDNLDFFVDNMMIPRLLTRMIRDVSNLIENYQNYYEETFLFQPLKVQKTKEEDSGKAKDSDEIKKISNNCESKIRIEHLFLTDSQLKKYLEIRQEFLERVRTEVLQSELDSSIYLSTEKPNLVTQISIPFERLLNLERALKKREKRKEKKKKKKK
ncbi:MAG: tetratricopeptide repeat protein [Candidatus Heimdallarchaeaceae archaeon]